MKKTLLVLAILFSIAGTTQAQSKFSFGGRLGVNASTFSNDNTSFAVGYYAGGFVGYSFIPRISVRPEVDFSMQGAKYDNGGVEFNQDLYYLQVPIMINAKLIAGLSVEAGPQFGFLLGRSEHYAQIKEMDFNTFDFGLAVGAGFKFPLLPIKIEFRYVHGLTNIASSEVSSINFSDAQNRLFQLGVALEL